MRAVKQALFDRELKYPDRQNDPVKVELENIVSLLQAIDVNPPEKSKGGWNSPAHDKDPTNM